MRTAFPNAAFNPHFELQDYGNPTLTATGWLCTRWRWEQTGNGITASLNTTDGNVNLEKWVRSRACAQLAVDAATYDPVTEDGLLRQRVPLLDRCGRQEALLRVVAFGPDGGSFEIGLSGSLTQRRYRTVVTQGNTPGGTPIWTTGRLREQITELSQTYLTLEAFSNPADLDATYRICHVQLDFLMPGEPDPPLYYSPPSTERIRCAPYLWPCPRWTPCQSTSASQVIVPTVALVEMNATPSLVAGAASVDFVQQTNASLFTSVAPSPSLDATFKDKRGGRVIMAAFTTPGALGSGVHGMVGTERAFLLEAELG